MDLERAFFRELGRLAPQPAPLSGVVTAADFAELPEPARRYLRFMGVEGRPRDESFRLHANGRFRLTPEGAWKRCEIWQYDHAHPITRLFYMRMRMGGILPVIARDSYVDGHGHMLGKLFDRFTVADASGDEFDSGELVTYLNDLVLFAPSMLLTPEVSWRAASAHAFDVALTDRGRTVTGRVFIGQRGEPLDFETTDRFYAPPNDADRPVRARWTTPIDGMQTVDGRRLPTGARAVWHLPDGPFPYAELDIRRHDIAFNVAPGR